MTSQGTPATTAAIDKASLTRLLRRQARAVPIQARGRSCAEPGVNLITYGRLANGVGEASRLVAELLDRAGVATEVYSHDLETAPGETHARLFGTTIAALNATDHLIAAAVLPRLFLPTRHRIGVWHWEVDAAPLKYRLARPWADEIWTTSAYQQHLMAVIYERPVHVLPLPVELAPRDEALVETARLRMGAGDRFVFSFQFDWNSSRRRKNPDGVIDAYLRAFPDPDSGTFLFIKTINGGQHPEALLEMTAAVRDRPDVLVLDEFWPSALNAALSHAVDCYVSLHRAEGFGLTIAKAMAAGKPVIATDYSGNLDFMPAGTALLVPSRIVSVGADPIYPPEGHWAQPDLDCAAEYMRSIAGDSVMRRGLGERARAHILATRRSEQSAAWVRDRLAGVL